jgi:RES domain-containing protein
MDRKLALTIASAPTCAVRGEFYRHVSPDIDHLQASASGGRWGAPSAYPVLYLGRPVDSVVIEAYRHLVDDDLDGMPASAVGPRRLLTCEIDVERILDLRDAETQRATGLDPASLRSDVGAYGPCWRISQVAHQLELWGVIAPAAGGMGETLALFQAHVPVDRWPRLVESSIWSTLPADPRLRLRLADAGDQFA